MTTRRGPLRVAASHLAYGLAMHLVALLAALPAAVRCLREPAQAGWIRGRFGRLPEQLPEPRPIWVHAVSVGEVKAARGLVAALRQAQPEVPIVLSTGTLTGFATARQAFPDLAVFPFPFDLAWVVRRLVRRLRPRLQILLELEVWPALMRALDEAGVPQVILNGRVSENSFRTYRRFTWFLPEFDRLGLVAAQDETYAERIVALGVPAERVHVTGNLKHDLTRAPVPERVAALGAELGLAGGAPVFVAGSTHDGEDAQVLGAWRAAGGGARCRLVIVPRHLDRLREIERLLRKQGVEHRRRSEARGDEPDDCVLLVDTMGELEPLFGLATVVFLGGSLVPVGGHNVLEPAAAGRAQIVGPHLESCRREAEHLAAAGGLLIVDDEQGLAAALRRLLDDPGACAALGASAAAAASQLKGATERDLALLAETGFLEGSLL